MAYKVKITDSAIIIVMAQTVLKSIMQKKHIVFSRHQANIVT